MSVRIDSPDWTAAAAELLVQCWQLPNLEDRVSLLERLCSTLGNNLYPAFLQLLCQIQISADAQAKAMITDTLVTALTTQRLPAAQLPSSHTKPDSANNPFARSRSLGPIEFICAWYAQPSGLSPLSEAHFTISLSTLMKLVDSNREARRLYCHKIMTDVIENSFGLYSSATRKGLNELAKTWNLKGESSNAAHIFVQIVDASDTLKQLQHDLSHFHRNA